MKAGALSVSGEAAPVRSPTSASPSSRRALVFPGVLLADGVALACQVRRASDFAERARGLLGFAPLQPGQALWILKCPSIHTVGMGYAIDVVFLDADDRILRVAESVGPLRFRLCRNAVSTVELLAGQAGVLGLARGQRLAVGAAATVLPSPVAANAPATSLVSPVSPALSASVHASSFRLQPPSIA